MTEWRGLVGGIVLAASVVGAEVAADLQAQRLDIPWSRLDATSQQRFRKALGCCTGDGGPA